MPLVQSIIRITKELGALQKGSDLSLAVACRDIDVRNVRALIIGPHQTPYEFGFFEFVIRFSDDYPSKAPSVISVTTDGGRCRFNPNIYSDGKVCLSILGTWRGEKGEEWSSAQGLESILISIQSLMSSNPYENEPGFESADTVEDRMLQKSYNQKISHETLRISVINRLEGYLGLKPDGTKDTTDGSSGGADADEADEAAAAFEPFKDLCKNRFLWYYDSYLAITQRGKVESETGEQFVRMPFESHGSNSMEGVFDFTSLEKRLVAIKSALDHETRSWELEGATAAASESTVAINLKHQYSQVVSRMRMQTAHDAILENNNPFVWIVTYFGQLGTKLDGGLFRIRITFSPRFPWEQPRVRFETKIFHHLVAKDGTACYTPNPAKREDVWSHIEAIIDILDDEDPAYDPRKIVNLEATELYWNGKESDKNKYYRRLCRSAQDSGEDFPE